MQAIDAIIEEAIQNTGFTGHRWGSIRETVSCLNRIMWMRRIRSTGCIP